MITDRRTLKQELAKLIGKAVSYQDTGARVHVGWLSTTPEDEYVFTAPGFEDIFCPDAVQGIQVGKNFLKIVRKPAEDVCCFERVKTADDCLRSSWNFDRLSFPLYDIHQDSKKWRKGAH